jgi:hypothetical protein
MEYGQTAHNTRFTLRARQAGTTGYEKLAVGALPLCAVFLRHIFCALEMLSHFLLSRTKNVVNLFALNEVPTCYEAVRHGWRTEPSIYLNSKLFVFKNNGHDIHA